jgi:hypothetical protein
MLKAASSPGLAAIAGALQTIFETTEGKIEVVRNEPPARLLPAVGSGFHEFRNARRTHV